MALSPNSSGWGYFAGIKNNLLTSIPANRRVFYGLDEYENTEILRSEYNTKKN